MIIRTSLLAGAFLSMLLIFGTTSCKKCKLSGENESTGMIVTEAIIYPSSGYLTSNLGGNMHVTATHVYANKFEVSFDGGATRVPVDYSQYSILSSAMTVSCEASLTKSVTYDSNLDIYTYSVTGETCSSCNQDRYIENYVLVSAIPDGAQIIFDQNVTQK